MPRDVECTVIPDDYTGPKLTEAVVAALKVLNKHGFRVRTSTGGNARGATLKVYRPNAGQVAYINQTIIGREGSLGYRFTEPFLTGSRPKNAPPTNDRKALVSQFCDR